MNEKNNDDGLYSLQKSLQDVCGKEIPIILETSDSNTQSVDSYSGFKQWSSVSGNYFPAEETISELTSGYYEPIYSDRHGWGLSKKSIISDKLFIMPNMGMDTILDDIQRFWSSKEAYQKYEYIYKRGILLYGPPGCGKSSIITLLSEKVIAEHNGMVINVTTPNNISGLIHLLNSIRAIEGDRQIIVILEDVDNFEDYGKSTMTEFLNLLDGNLKTDNIVYIATTNYPKKLAERIVNRPSRFDRRYEVGLPNAEDRTFYVNNILKKSDLKKLDMNKLIHDTEGFSIDYLKELVLSIFVLGKEYDVALKEIKDIFNGELVKTKKVGQKKLTGFNR